MKNRIVRNIFGRELIKLAMRPLLNWSTLSTPQEGYRIMLGVPWALRHLLSVNLDFVSRTDLTHCRAIQIVFDRRRKEGFEQIVEESRRQYPVLPLAFSHYPELVGFIAEKVDVSTFYNSLNCATVLPKIETKYAILHDFDLYPVLREYFEAVYQTIRKNSWHFCGLERTYFEGLTDNDNVFGTWCLGMDVQWLRRNFHPIDIFHKIKRIRGKEISLDPFSALELLTPKKGPIDNLDSEACCHVKNLCSTYLRHTTGRPASIVWRLHYLWYLEYLAGVPENLYAATKAMAIADSPVLDVGGYIADFSSTDSTCANVLRNELYKMERVVHGKPRQEVEVFVEEFQMFLDRFHLWKKIDVRRSRMC